MMPPASALQAPPAADTGLKSATSIFLDLLRVIAAAGGVFVHTGTPRFSSLFALAPSAGHHCVVIFFVLSGFVISHATLSKHRPATSYIVARLARLYSGLGPALLISAGLLTLARFFNAEYYAHYDRGHETVRFLLSLFYLNEVWWLSAAPPTNS